MRKLLSILSLLILLTAGSLQAQDKTKPVEATVKESLVRITGEDSAGDTLFVCTGWATTEPRKYFTAAHCIPDKVETMEGLQMDYILKANGVRALPVKIDTRKDLALFIVDIVKPGLVLRETGPRLFEYVMAAGYGHGFTVPIFTHNRVIMLHYNLDRPSIYPGTMYEGAFVGGMSGGPVFDYNGEVIGIVQRGSNFIGYGVDNKVLRDFMKE